MQIYYRPSWTSGNYHNKTHSAIMYNLIAGYSFFFEDESADIIVMLLKTKRNYPINVVEVSKETNISQDSIIAFFDQLLCAGLLTTEATNPNTVMLYRKQLSEYSIALGSLQTNLSQDIELSDAEQDYGGKTGLTTAVVMLELTYNCSEKCIHCYNPGATRNDKEISHRNEREELTWNDYKNLIDDLAAGGTAKVCLTGGDPFSRPFIWQMLEYLYEKGIAVQLYTNGLALYGKVDLLADLYPFDVSISLYGATPEIHDKITRTPGSFEKSLAVLEELKKYHITSIIKCCLMRSNFKSYPQKIKIAERLNAPIIIDVLRDPRCQYYVGKEIANYGGFSRNKGDTACMVGYNNVCVTPEGIIIPCCSFHTPLGNVKDGNINELLTNNRKLRKIKHLFLREYSECGSHDYCDFCILCPGMNFTETGSPFLPSENSCYFAQVRYSIYQKLLCGIDPLAEGLELSMNKIAEDTCQNVSRKMTVSYLNKPIGKLPNLLTI